MYYLYLLMVFIQGCVVHHIGISPIQWEWWVIVACTLTIWIAGNERGEKFGGGK